MSNFNRPLGPIGVIILAAGQGKRMRSQLPKVLHDLAGEPLIFHVLQRISEVLPQAEIAIVVGHGREQVEEALRGADRFSNLKMTFVHQPVARGTGDAANCAMQSEWGMRLLARKGAQFLILPGDFPLLSVELIEAMVEPVSKGAALRLLTCELSDPTGYGRVLRKGTGARSTVIGIVEEKDANSRQKKIREVANSIYLFEGKFLEQGLKKLRADNAQGEFYLTDLVAQAAKAKKKIDVLCWGDSSELRGVNDPWELAQASRIMNEKIIRAHSRNGVRFIDPWSNHVDSTATIDADATIHPGAILKGKTTVSTGAVIGPHCVLNDMRIGEGANIKTGTVGESSEIGARAQVGPYAHLRPESQVGEEAKIGNFVELKKSRIGRKTSVAHLSYIGDAEVGERVNIGCGFVTCNFDGRVIERSRKHKTVIEDDVFLGSDCQAVAPVRIGKGSYVASGSTITEDVEAGALAIARSRQVNKAGYAARISARVAKKKAD